KAVKKNRGAAGIDKISISMFERQLDQNLAKLMKDLKSGAYQPKPLRRKLIPKAPGKFRPLGIPAVRDRVAQEVIRKLVEPYFEPHFSELSFGFRPNRNCHQAIRKMLTFFYVKSQDKSLKYLEYDSHIFFMNSPSTRRLSNKFHLETSGKSKTFFSRYVCRLFWGNVFQVINLLVNVNSLSIKDPVIKSLFYKQT
ncbi:MAG TPA: hypothetical protein ENH23_08015, partial [candidate division Zixibacteria bacterium]|nr:hypothetical protein [candidate division Zixibacteria bacterium]